MNFLLFLEYARFIPVTLVMGYAALSDYRTGEVSNKIWLYAIFGGLLTILETVAIFSYALLIVELVSVSIAVAFSFLFFMVGGWGGADAKAFMVLGVSAPIVPVWSLYPLPLPILVLVISCACAIAFPHSLFKKSDVPFLKRKVRFLPFMFIGLLITVVL